MLRFLKRYFPELVLIFLLTGIQIFLAVLNGISIPWGGSVLSPWVELFFTKLEFGLLLAIPLFIIASAVAARTKWKLLAKLALFSGLMLISLVIGATLAYDNTQNIVYSDIIKYMITLGVAGLGVFIIPSLMIKEKKDSWSYMATCLKALVVSYVYGALAFIGFGGAVLAINLLLGVAVGATVYSIVGTLCMFTLSWTIFLYTLSRYTARDQEVMVPRLLELLAKYILIPVQVIYIVIYYIYLLMQFTKQAPLSNELIWLSLIFILPGFISLAILYPQRLIKGNWYSKLYYWFYAVNLIPVTFVYMYVVVSRIVQYGFTVDRFLILIIGFMLGLLAIYSPIARFFRIDVYLLVFAGLLLLAFYFPVLNINNISRWDQENRFIGLLTDQGIISNGIVLTADKHEVSLDAYNRIRSNFNYLDSNYSLEVLRPYLGSQQFDTMNSKQYGFDKFDEFVGLANLTYSYQPNANIPRSLVLSYPLLSAADKQSYDSATSFYITNGVNNDKNGNRLYSNALTINQAGKPYEYDLTNYVKQAIKTYGDTSSASLYNINVNASKLTDYQITLSQTAPQIVFVPNYISVTYNVTTDVLSVNNITGTILVKN